MPPLQKRDLLTTVYHLVYNGNMKKKDIEKQISKLGWYLTRHGAKHDIWTNGVETIEIPRHREVNEFTARGIIKIVKANPGK